MLALFGFGIGMMFSSFHVCGMMLLVRYASPSGPMCLRCLMLTLSGHVEFILLCFIAAWTCVVVSVIVVVCSLCVLCLTVL